MMGFAHKEGAWRGKMLMQMLLMIRSWKSAVAGWAGQKAKGVPPPPPTHTPPMPNVQSFKYLTVCWATAHKYAQPLWVMSRLLRIKWRQRSERRERCIDCNCNCILQILLHSVFMPWQEKKRFIKYIILPVHKKDVLCTQWLLVYLYFVCHWGTQVPVSTHIVIRNINIEFPQKHWPD